MEDKNVSDLYEEIKKKRLVETLLIILSILNAKYWANERRKTRTKSSYDKNEEEYQRKINFTKKISLKKRNKKKDRRSKSSSSTKKILFGQR